MDSLAKTTPAETAAPTANQVAGGNALPALPPSIEAIMQQIMSLPAAQRAQTLAALGVQVTVATTNTQEEIEFTGHKTELLRKAVKGVYEATKERVFKPSLLGIDRQRLRLETANVVINAMGFHQKNVSTHEYEAQSQALDTYFRLIAEIESSPNCINYEDLTPDELGTLLSTASEPLVKSGTKERIARILKAKILALPLAVEAPAEDYWNINRNRYTHAYLVKVAVKSAPLESTEQGVELLKRIQPQMYLGDDGALKVADASQRTPDEFAAMIATATRAFPSYAMKIFVQDMYMFAHKYREEDDRAHILARVAQHDDQLADRIRPHLKSQRLWWEPHEPCELELFNYYLLSYQKLRALGPRDTRNDLPLHVGSHGCLYRLTSFEREIRKSVAPKLLVDALCWQELIPMLETHAELKFEILMEILRQLRGETVDHLGAQLAPLTGSAEASSKTLQFLKTLIASDAELHGKLRKAIASQKETRKSELSKALGLN